MNPDPDALLTRPWSSVADHGDQARAAARAEGRRTADAYFGIAPDLISVHAAQYYAEVLNTAIERGTLAPEDLERWTDLMARGEDADPRLAAFADGVRERVAEWAAVRRLAGDRAVEEMVREGTQALLEPEPSEDET